MTATTVSLKQRLRKSLNSDKEIQIFNPKMQNYLDFLSLCLVYSQHAQTWRPTESQAITSVLVGCWDITTEDVALQIGACSLHSLWQLWSAVQSRAQSPAMLHWQLDVGKWFASPSLCPGCQCVEACNLVTSRSQELGQGLLVATFYNQLS